VPEVLGVVPVLGRGPLASLHLGGRSLADRAVETVRAVTSEVLVVSEVDDQQAVRDHLAAAAVVLVHDPLCPLVPTTFLRTMLESSGAAPRVGVRPVVDTLKETGAGEVLATVDREQFRVVCSPLVVSGESIAAVALPWSGLGDLALLVSELRDTTEVELVAAPSSARRIEDGSDLELAASIDAVGIGSRQS